MPTSRSMKADKKKAMKAKVMKACKKKAMKAKMMKADKKTTQKAAMKAKAMKAKAMKTKAMKFGKKKAMKAKVLKDFVYTACRQCQQPIEQLQSAENFMTLREYYCPFCGGSLEIRTLTLRD